MHRMRDFAREVEVGMESARHPGEIKRARGFYTRVRPERIEIVVPRARSGKGVEKRGWRAAKFFERTRP